MDSVHVGGLGGTYGGNPVACAAALGAIRTMREQDLSAAAQRIASIMLPRLHDLQEPHPVIGDVRGRGAAGREGLLPAAIGRVYPTRRTPVVALCVFLGFSLLLVFAWGGRTDPLEFFAQSSTLGTILVLVVYLVANFGLPVYYRRYRPAEFSGLRHAVWPLLGVAAIPFPLYELVKPGQPAPYNRFPLTCAAIIAGSGRPRRLDRRRQRLIRPLRRFPGHVSALRAQPAHG